jgi:hypothetical protein
MTIPPVLVVDWERSTSRIFAEALDLEGYTVGHEKDLRKGFDFLQMCDEPHVAIVRFQLMGWRKEFDWYRLLSTTRRLQRHAYIEAWACADLPEDTSRRAILARFGATTLPCPCTADEFLDALESARARLLKRG